MISIVNEVSGRKSTLRAKLKAASQEEGIQKWKEHFKNLVINKPIKQLPTRQQTRTFYREKFVLLRRKKFKAGMLQALTEYLLKYGKQGNLIIYFFDYAT